MAKNNNSIDQNTDQKKGKSLGTILKDTWKDIEDTSLLGSLGSAVGGIAGNLIGGGMQSTAGDVMNTLGNIGGIIPGPWGAALGAGFKVLGGGVNALVGTKVDQEKLNAANAGTSYLNNFVSNATSFDDVQGPQAQAYVQDAYKGGALVGDAAKRKNQKLRDERRAAQLFANNSVVNNIGNIAAEQDNTLLANYAAFGGNLLSNGAAWDNGLTFIGNGGTHEANPYDGVPMGMDNQGIPNLVEEGEVIWNDYVFSKRLKVPKAFREKYKLGNDDSLSFADAAKKFSQEMEERPNDPISKAGRDSLFTSLMDQQEQVREKMQQRKAKRQFNALSPEEQMGIMQMAQQYAANNQANPTGPEESEMINTPVKKEAKHGGRLYNPGGELNKGLDKGYDTWIRYAPVVGAGLNTINDALGWTNTPDYSNAKRIEDASLITPRKVSAPVLGDYLTYNPFDRNMYANQLRSSAAASRRSIANLSGGNRATAMAGLLASDYNTLGNLGKLYREADEYNQNQRTKVAEFNRGTNQFNSQMLLDASKINQSAEMEAAKTRLSGITTGAQLRAAEDAQVNANRSANINSFLQGIADIGRENMNWNWRNSLYNTGMFGKSNILEGKPLLTLTELYGRGSLIKAWEKGLKLSPMFSLNTKE